MALSDFANVSVTTDAAQVERAGYGVALILASDCPGGFTERVRTYSDLTGLVADFATTTATYRMAAVLFAQNPKPTSVKVGRLANKPTMSWRLTPVASDSTKYELEVDNTAVSVTSDADATVAEITAALKTAIDLLALSGVTTVDNSTSLDISGAAGAFHSVEVLDSTRIKIAQTATDAGVEADLIAIALEDNAWYALLNSVNSKAIAKEIADWAESNDKLFLCQTQDSDVVNLSQVSDTGGSETIAGQLRGTDFRTALLYHPDTDAFADAAWAGARLTTDPGSETWAITPLAGVAPVTLTATQRANALAKYVNTFEEVAGNNVTSNTGVVTANEYIDVIRFRDWLRTEMAADVFAAMLKAAKRGKKIPYTDGGIALIAAVMRARLNIGVAVGGLAADPEPVVTVPLAADVSDADKAARLLQGIKADAVLAGAIHKITLAITLSL